MSHRLREIFPPHRFTIPPTWTGDFHHWQQGPGAAVAVDVRNQGHEWFFQGPGFVASWWPSTGKFVMDRRFKHAVTIRDHRKVMAAVERRLPKVRPLKEEQPGWVAYVESLVMETA